jgi:hypothetical protein
MYCSIEIIGGSHQTVQQLLNRHWALKGRNNKPEKLAPPLLDFIDKAKYDCNVLVTIDTHADVSTGELVYAGRGEGTSSATIDDVRVHYYRYTSYSHLIDSG